MEGKDNPPPYGSPPQQTYPPAGQGYPPPQQGYPPPQQGYPPPQQGYAPQGYSGYPALAPMQQQQQQQQSTVIINQPAVGGAVLQISPRDYTVSSILVCLFCFFPTGLLAIYYASRSRTEVSMGNIEEARMMSFRARNMIVASVICGIAWAILVIVLQTTATDNTYYYGNNNY